MRVRRDAGRAERANGSRDASSWPTPSLVPGGRAGGGGRVSAARKPA
ncbi:hypothetical protein GLE_1330 [Lysobacter enzymogenes]|uniref:Uncharacterized protein n=1 Tax=Lysobacter enzymogenes TaxID=69 RepID=A0A0S2DE98_LYSEN|nr:hypothetical protein GLE_1330 [Lysobacter enzymogenes]